MTRLKVIDAKTMQRVLLALGFQEVRQKAVMSSIGIRMAEPRRCLITPIGDLAQPLIREILREIELSPDQFQTVLRTL